MTCAKRQVWCEIETADGRRFYGDNGCRNPQEVCPRAPGEGYEKCRTICQQKGHAEVNAVIAASIVGASLEGAKATVGGHYYVCEHCARTLRDQGVATILIDERRACPGASI